ncbi:MAG: hypothetical protein AB8B94_05475 [Hyphomicrobiales bacterium]
MPHPVGCLTIHVLDTARGLAAEELENVDAHFHVSLLFSPFGYSAYSGS